LPFPSSPLSPWRVDVVVGGGTYVPSFFFLFPPLSFAGGSSMRRSAPPLSLSPSPLSFFSLRRLQESEAEKEEQLSLFSPFFFPPPWLTVGWWRRGFPSPNIMRADDCAAFLFPPSPLLFCPRVGYWPLLPFSFFPPPSRNAGWLTAPANDPTYSFFPPLFFSFLSSTKPLGLRDRKST